MARRMTLFELPSDAGLPVLSRILHIRGAGHTGMRKRQSKDHELHFIGRGHLHFQFGSEDRVLHAGEVLYTGPDTAYGLSADAPANLSCFHCHFSMPDARIVDEDMSTGAAWRTLASADAMATGRERMFCLPEQLTLRDPRAFSDLFLAVRNDQRGHHPGDAIAAQARFLLLLRAISHEAITGLGRAVSTTSPSTSAHAHVARALELIGRHPGRHVTASGIAKLVGVDADYLARLFRREVGCRMGTYVLRRAVSVAQERLLAESSTIRDIAADLGFEDALYFSRVFKRSVGCSPREFRNR